MTTPNELVAFLYTPAAAHRHDELSTTKYDENVEPA